MAVTLPTTITGGAQTGFTTPGYTGTTGQYPGYNGRQNYVTALTGTQANVRVHSANDPFTYAFAVAPSIKTVPQASNGVYGAIPVNVHYANVRKGLVCASGAPIQIGMADVKFRVPAGAESNDPANVRAMISLLIGYLNAVSAGLGDSLVTGQP